MWEGGFGSLKLKSKMVSVFYTRTRGDDVRKNNYYVKNCHLL